jgi:hypothetical protein
MYLGSIIVIWFLFVIGDINPLNPPFLGDFKKMGDTPKPPPEGDPSGLPNDYSGKKIEAPQCPWSFRGRAPLFQGLALSL